VLTDPSWPHKVVWHGAKVDSIDSNCENWQNNSDKRGLGSSLLGNKLLGGDQGILEKFLLQFMDFEMSFFHP
jgi:hypothetical protein